MNWRTGRGIAADLSQTVGFTPMVRLNRVSSGWTAEVLAKLEYFGPSGSVKDRILFHMIEQAELRGDLTPGMTIIEATTGNTGIATAMAGAVRGYPVVIVMPDGMSEERKKAIRAYGAQLILTLGGESDVDLVLERVAEIVREAPGQYWEVRQFSNPDNPAAHYDTTGPEIWEQTGGAIDAFVAAVGTGGTLAGISRYLKERNRACRVYAVEPAECAILSGGNWGSHHIEGIGDGFVPDNLDLDVVDGVVRVSTDEAVAMAMRLAREEGLFSGISSGCNVAACHKVSLGRPEIKRIVTVINDNGLRYCSTVLCGEPKPVPSARSVTVSQRDRDRLAGRELEIIT